MPPRANHVKNTLASQRDKMIIDIGNLPANERLAAVMDVWGDLRAEADYDFWQPLNTLNRLTKELATPHDKILLLDKVLSDDILLKCLRKHPDTARLLVSACVPHNVWATDEGLATDKMIIVPRLNKNVPQTLLFRDSLINIFAIHADFPGHHKGGNAAELKEHAKTHYTSPEATAHFTMIADHLMLAFGAVSKCELPKLPRVAVLPQEAAHEFKQLKERYLKPRR